MISKNNKKIKITAGVIISALVLSLFVHITPLPASTIFYFSTKGIVELMASSDEVGESYGTAVCVNRSDTLITNAHVVSYSTMGSTHTFDNISIRTARDEAYLPVEIVAYDLNMDIAVLRITTESIRLTPLRLGDSNTVSFGDSVYAIGNGSNNGLAITKGIISIPRTNIEHDGICRSVIQCDLSVAPGNSGGALLDKKGRLIGLTTFRIKDDMGNINCGFVYSLPINTIVNFLNSKT